MHPASPTRNKIIYKTACSNGPNSGSGRPSQNRLRSKGPPQQSWVTHVNIRFLFFSSSMADVALWLGPYMSISSKTSLYKDPKGPAMQANHNKPKTTQKKPDDPQIPQPDLRFATRKSKPDTQKGPEPKRKQPQKRFASGRSGQTPASLTKTCKK